MPDQKLERVAQWTPFLIVGYFALHFLIRILTSGNLETDEAQFVGHTDLALGYGNSHPPLYNWLVAAGLYLTGGHWASAVALVKTILLGGTYLLAYDTMRRITGRALPGLIIAVSFLLLPQVVWKAQITLAHTVMVMFAVVALLHALVCVIQQGSTKAFLWLGIAASIGALAKYNFFIMLFAALVAAASIKELRPRIFQPKLSISTGIMILLFMPHAIWAAQHIDASTARMAKLERDNEVFGAFDLPWIGIDGFLALVLAIIAWAGPLLLIWFIILQMSKPRQSEESDSNHSDNQQLFQALFGRSMMIGVGLFALIVLVADLHSVHERYITPLLIVLPFWLALTWPIDVYRRAPLHFLRVGVFVVALIFTAWPLWIAFGKEQLVFPYAAFANTLPPAKATPRVVLSGQEKYAANIAVQRDDTQIWRPDVNAMEAVIIWMGEQRDAPQRLAEKLGGQFEPVGSAIRMTQPYRNFSGIEARMNAQIYARSRSRGSASRPAAGVSASSVISPRGL